MKKILILLLTLTTLLFLLAENRSVYHVEKQHITVWIKFIYLVKKILILLLTLTTLLFLLAENRSVYHVEKQHITVWKTFGGTCYIMPYIYCGLIKPSRDYVVVDNTNMDIVAGWNKSDLKTIIIYSYDKKISANSCKIKFILCSRSEIEDRLYETKIRQLKKNIETISIHVFESWATDKNNVKL